MSAFKLPKSQGGLCKSAPVAIVHTGFASKPRNHELGEPIHFYGQPALGPGGNLDLIPQDCSLQTQFCLIAQAEQSGLSILKGDSRSSGPLVDCCTLESSKLLSYVISVPPPALYCTSLHSKNGAHALHGLTCNHPV